MRRGVRLALCPCEFHLIPKPCYPLHQAQMVLAELFGATKTRVIHKKNRAATFFSILFPSFHEPQGVEFKWLNRLKPTDYQSKTYGLPV